MARINLLTLTDEERALLLPVEVYAKLGAHLERVEEAILAMRLAFIELGRGKLLMGLFGPPGPAALA